jgi:membrane associated rhomboid family serine protease
MKGFTISRACGLWFLFGYILLLFTIHAASLLAPEFRDTFTIYDMVLMHRAGDPHAILGIFTAHLLHGSWGHLLSNSITLVFWGFVLSLVQPSLVLWLPLLGAPVASAALWFLMEPGTEGLGSSLISSSIVTAATFGLIFEPEEFDDSTWVRWGIVGTGAAICIELFFAAPGSGTTAHQAGFYLGVVSMVGCLIIKRLSY